MIYEPCNDALPNKCVKKDGLKTFPPYQLKTLKIEASNKEWIWSYFQPNPPTTQPQIRSLITVAMAARWKYFWKREVGLPHWTTCTPSVFWNLNTSWLEQLMVFLQTLKSAWQCKKHNVNSGKNLGCLGLEGGYGHFLCLLRWNLPRWGNDRKYLT